MHKDYLEQYHTARYSYLLLYGKLWTYLADLNEQARERMECMITQMKAAEGVTEELKARDTMAWVGAMNGIRSRAEEIILVGDDLWGRRSIRFGENKVTDKEWPSVYRLEDRWTLVW